MDPGPALSRLGPKQDTVPWGETLLPSAGVAGWEVVVASPTSSLMDMGSGISGQGIQECRERFSLVGCKKD